MNTRTYPHYSAFGVQLAMDVLDVALEWLRHEGGQVAIHDATNSTVARRCVGWGGVADRMRAFSCGLSRMVAREQRMHWARTRCPHRSALQESRLPPRQAGEGRAGDLCRVDMQRPKGTLSCLFTPLSSFQSSRLCALSPFARYRLTHECLL